MVAEVGDCRSQFEALLGSCELLETPFDQTKFESDVNLLQEKMALCDTVSLCVLPVFFIPRALVLLYSLDLPHCAFGTLASK